MEVWVLLLETSEGKKLVTKAVRLLIHVSSSNADQQFQPVSLEL